MSEIEFPRGDGELCRGYLAEPADGQNAGAVVIIHEMWGLTPAMMEMAERCAAQGYRALVPDLFGGRRPADLEAGLALMGALDMRGAADRELRAAARWLKRTAPRVAVLGFCMGGALAIVAAARLPELDAAVCFYGVPPAELTEAAAIRVPVLGHFATRDDWCTPAKVDALERALRSNRVEHELHRYEAGHAFMNRGGHAYFEPAAALAWQRTLDFLKRELA